MPAQILIRAEGGDAAARGVIVRQLARAVTALDAYDPANPPVFVLAPSRSRCVPATVLAALFLVATLAALAVDSSAVANVFRSLVVPPSPSPVRVSTYVPLVRRGVLSWLLP